MDESHQGKDFSNSGQIMSRVYSPSTEALIAQLEDRMAQGRRFGVPTAPGSSAQDVRNWLDESDLETIEQLKGLIRFCEHEIAYRREDYETRRHYILSCLAAVAILAGLTGIWMAIPNRFSAGEPLLGSVWLSTHVVAPLALMILFAVPYTRRGLLTGHFGIFLVAILGIWSVASLFLFPMWWPTALGGQEFGILIALVGLGILILALVGGWAYKTWHNPREGLRTAATMVPFLAVGFAAIWLEQRYGVNWWLTAVPATGALILVEIIIERRRKKRGQSRGNIG